MLDELDPYPTAEPPTDPAGRLLRLLSLLQLRPVWAGPDLAQRLGVTTRTVRRDVDRLRRLGYPVDAAPGVDGGYRLGPGAAMPPLLLDDDEATAATIALRAAAIGPVGGIEEAALSALGKLDRVLPPRLRSRVDALRDATVYLGADAAGVDPEVLVVAARASAARIRLRLVYRDRQDRETERRIEPHKLVCTGRRWYLVARDVDRTDDEAGGWRTFRVDRVLELVDTGHRFHLDDPPDAAELVARAISVAPYPHQARVRFDVPADELRARVPPTVGSVEADGPRACVLVTGAFDFDQLAAHLLWVGLPFEVLDPPEARRTLAELGEQLVERHRR